MYSFAQRSDCRVWDEPLYPHFLRVTGAERPDREATLNALDADGNRVIRQQLLAEPLPDENGKVPNVLFFKHIANQFTGLDDYLLPELDRHIIFIRDPAKIIASYSKVIAEPKLEDIAMQRCTAMFRKLRMLRLSPIVLDSRELLLNPEATLKALCAALSIPFDSKMLAWPAGARPEDGPWAKFWYHGVHRSTGFSKESGPAPQLNGALAELEGACRLYYDYLQSFRLQP